MIENALVVDLQLERQLGSQIGGLSFFSHTLINLEAAGIKNVIVVTRELSGEFIFAWKGLCQKMNIEFVKLGRGWTGTEAAAYVKGMKRLKKVLDSDGKPNVLEKDDVENAVASNEEGGELQSSKMDGAVGVPFLVICENHIHDPSLVKMLADYNPPEDDCDVACLVEEDVIGMVGVNERTVYAGWPMLHDSHITSIGTGLPAYNGIFAGAAVFFPSTSPSVWLEGEEKDEQSQTTAAEEDEIQDRGGEIEEEANEEQFQSKQKNKTKKCNGKRSRSKSKNTRSLINVLSTLALNGRVRLIKNANEKIWLSGQSQESIEFSRKRLDSVGKKHKLTTGQIVELLRTSSSKMGINDADGATLQLSNQKPDPRHTSVDEEKEKRERDDLRRKLSSNGPTIDHNSPLQSPKPQEKSGAEVNDDDDDDDTDTITTEDDNNSEWSEFTVSKWRSAVFTTKSFFQQLYQDTHSYIVDQINALGGLENVCVIEVGCGTGETIIPLHEHAKYCIGVDINPLFIEYCRKENEHDNVAFVYGDATKLDSLLTRHAVVSSWVGNGMKKLVICTGNTIGIIPEFLRDDIYKSMAKIAGADGRCVVVYWNGDHFAGAVENFYGKNPQLCGTFDIDKHVNFEKCTLQTPTGYSTKWTRVDEARKLMKGLGLESINVAAKEKGVMALFRVKK
eukprot:m.155835 g.155835  ORF g.155835 m.155835 type:complete len:676 (-) comp13330_c0_seq2:2739-4766(-)